MTRSTKNQQQQSAVNSALVWGIIRGQIGEQCEIMEARAQSEHCAHVAADLRRRLTGALSVMSEIRDELTRLGLR